MRQHIILHFILTFVFAIVFAIIDIKYKKIPNVLVIIAITTGACLNLVFDYIHIKIFLLNLFISIIIGFSLFYFKLWKAGDGKLLIALASLMEPISPIKIIPIPLLLTIITFILGLIIVLPSILIETLKVIITNPKTRNKFIASLFQQTVTIISTVWAVKLLWKYLHMPSNNLILYFIVYKITFAARAQLTKRAPNMIWYINIIGILLFSFFYLPTIPTTVAIKYIIASLLYTLTYTIIDNSLEIYPISQKEKRIPLAPIMGIATFLIFQPKLLSNLLYLTRKL